MDISEERMMNLPFDRMTGEIFDLEAVREHELKVHRANNKSYVIPLDLTKVMDLQDLLEYNESLYGVLYYPAGALDMESMMIDWKFSNPELQAIAYLSGRVGHHNLVYVRIKELMERAGWKKSATYSTIQKLEDKKIIKKTENKNVVKLHPFFQWRGNSTRRWEEFMQWHIIDSGINNSNVNILTQKA